MLFPFFLNKLVSLNYFFYFFLYWNFITKFDTILHFKVWNKLSQYCVVSGWQRNIVQYGFSNCWSLADCAHMILYIIILLSDFSAFWKLSWNVERQKLYNLWNFLDRLKWDLSFLQSLWFFYSGNVNVSKTANKCTLMP